MKSSQHKKKKSTVGKKDLEILKIGDEINVDIPVLMDGKEIGRTLKIRRLD